MAQPRLDVPDPVGGAWPMSGAIEERFWAKVEPTGFCWEWIGSIDREGYGRFSSGRQKWAKAHRVAYELLVGEIPDGLVVDHLCRNRACVNPDHLEPVTIAENTRRGTAVHHACPSGHRYDEANTYTGSGYRRCRTCNREAAARYAARRRAA